MRKNIGVFVIFLILINIFSFNCFAYENILDEANIFSTSLKQEIDSRIYEIESEHGFDIVVVVKNQMFNNNTSEYAEYYANQLYDSNGYGFGIDKIGALMYINMHQNHRDLVIVLNQPESEIYINNRQKENILDDISESLRDGNYDDALIYFVDEIEESLGNPSVLNDFIDSIGFESFVLAVIVCVVYMGILLFRHRPVKVAKNAKIYADNTTFELEEKEDTFLHTRTTSRRKSSGGGSSGGSSRSSGSRKF